MSALDSQCKQGEKEKYIEAMSGIMALFRAFAVFIVEVLTGFHVAADTGVSFLLKKALAAAFLSFWKSARKRRLDVYDPYDVKNPAKVGFIIPEIEWQLENPQDSAQLNKNTDEVLFWGSNSSGVCVSLHVARHPGHAAQVSLYVRDATGRRLVLPEALHVDHSSGSIFNAGRLRVICLIPMRKWRLVFNGQLREIGDNSGILHHVEFRFLVNTLGDAYDHTSDVSTEVVATSAATEPWLKVLGCAQRLFEGQDVYDQPMGMIGTMSVDGSASDDEVYLWGTRSRIREARHALLNKTSEHYFGVLSDRTMFHVTLESLDNSQKTFTHGFVVAPSLFVYAIDSCIITHAQKQSDVANFVRLQVKAGGASYEFYLMHPLSHVWERDQDAMTFEALRQWDIVKDTKSGYGTSLLLRRDALSSADVSELPVLPKVPRGDHREEKVLSLADSAAQDSDLCGGKASSLATLSVISMVKKQFKVPGGVVLTTKAYNKFRDHNALGLYLEDLKKYPQLESDQREEMLSRISDLVLQSQVPESLVTEVRLKLEEVLGSGYEVKHYAVRSSAVGEDSEDMSTAGQMETFLNVDGIGDVIEHVPKCWASQFARTSIEYKLHHGQPLEAAMAVVIQEMVTPDVAGVLFTCDPVSGNSQKMVIDANYGLGESIVSASAEPDTVTLLRSGDDQVQVHEVRVGKKQSKIVATGGSGTETQNVNSDEASKCSLSEEEATTLAAAAIKVERYYPTALDIEWALVGRQLYLLQARPITTIYRESDFEIEHEMDNAVTSEDEFYTRANVGEVLPGACSNLGFETFINSFNNLFRARVRDTIMLTKSPPSQYIWPGCNVVSYNYVMSLTDSMFQHREKQDMATKALMYGTLGRPFESKDCVTKYIERQGRQGLITRTRPLFYIVGAYFNTEKSREAALQALDNLVIPLRDSDTAEQMFNVILENMMLPAPVLMNLLCCSMVSSFFNLTLLSVLASYYGDLTPEVFHDVAALLSKCEDVESADVPAKLKELANAIRKEKPDFSTLSSEDAQRYLESDNGESGQQYQEMLRCHGHRCIKEFDVKSVPWELDPQPLIKTLQAVTSVEPSAAPSAEPASELQTPLNFWRRKVLEFVTPRTKLAVARREAAKAVVIKSIHVLRKALRKLGSKMMEEGRIPEADLVFFFSADELYRLLKTRASALVQKAVRRKRMHPALNKLTFPQIFRGLPKPARPNRGNERATGTMSVQGTPVSRGSVEGWARVVKVLDEAKTIKPGDILITHATDIGWSPYFPMISGLVTEIGGLLSHGAVIAREYGLPSVVGVDNATDIFSSGDYILLDASRGVVEKLEKPKN